MTILEELAHSLDLEPEEVIHQSLRAFLDKEIRLALEDITLLKDRYQVERRELLEEKMKNSQIPSYPAWEDLIQWENLEAYLEKLKTAQNKIYGNI